MPLTLEQLIEIFPDRLWLEFSTEERDRAWMQAQDYSNQSSRWTAYLNLLCLQSFLQYIESDPDLQNETLQISFNDLEKTGKSSLWEFMNGTVVEVGDRRLILIPRDTVNPDEFSVPWEWIDISTFAGDYYLAIEVNLEQQWLQFWGYTTHQKIKEKAIYENRDRTYNLPKEALIEDIEVLWVARELCPPERAKLETLELPDLADRKQQESIAKWGKISNYSPRLDLKEEELVTWAALLSSDRDRLELYEYRLNAQKSIHLDRWFKNIFEEGWQALEDVIDTVKIANSKSMRSAYAFRSQDAHNLASSSLAVPAIVNLLKSNSEPEIRRQATDILGSIGQGNVDAIATLTDIIKQDSDPDFRRQAAVTLKKIDPENSTGGVQRVKPIELGVEFDNHTIVLIITLVPDEENKINVHIRIDSLNPQDYLPANLQLEIFDDKGKIFDRIISRQSDIAIQCGLQCNLGDTFYVKIALGHFSFQEQFIF